MTKQTETRERIHDALNRRGDRERDRTDYQAAYKPKDGDPGFYMKDREATMEYIGHLHDELRWIEEELAHTIGAARNCVNHLEWSEIGRAYGNVTKQAAYKRFKHAHEVFVKWYEDDSMDNDGKGLRTLHRKMGITWRKGRKARTQANARKTVAKVTTNVGDF